MIFDDPMLGGVYILLAMTLVVGVLMARREPATQMVKLALGWIIIFAAGFVLFTFRDDLGYVFQRLRAEATGTPVVAAKQIRVPMAIDGHFWVDAKLNGRDVRFLVDSGATMTTIDGKTAQAAGVAVSDKADQFVRTGNGIIKVATGRAETLTVGPIERDDIGLQVVEKDDLNVLGMNYLSTLSRWSVEGRWLILVS